MVQDYIPGAPDLLSAASGYMPPNLPRPVNECHYFPTKDPDVYTFELTIRDLSMGLNRVWGALQNGDAGPDSHRLASSTLYTAYPGEATIPHKTTETDSTASYVPSNGKWLSWVTLNDVPYIGIGDGNGNSLLAGSISADTLTNKNYNPAGNVISHLNAIVIGGATTAARIVAGRVGAVAQVINADGVTVDGSMAANTASMWDLTTSGLNATTPGVPVHGIYANGGLFTIPASGAIGDAPTQTQTIPQGGYGAGEVSLMGWPARAFYVLPYQTTTSGMFSTTEPAPAYLAHCSLEFNDMQPMRGVPLRNVVFAKRWANNRLVITDCSFIKGYDGKDWNDLGWVTEREPNTSVSYRSVGFWEMFGELYTWSLRRDDNTAANTRWAVEKYDPQLNQWHQVSTSFVFSTLSSSSGTKGQTLVGTKYSVYPTGAGLPVNLARALLYGYNGNNGINLYATQYQQPAGVSDFNVTRGASTYESNGTARSVGMTMPTVPGGGRAVHVVEQVDPQGDVPAGGTGAYMQVQLATQTATGFSYSNNLKAQVLAADRVMRDPTRFIDNEAFFTRFQFQLYLDRASNTTSTPNGLPIVFRGLTFVRGRKPVSPRAFWRSVGQSSGKKVV